MLQYRAELDAAVILTTGGSVRTTGLLVDVPHPEVSRAEIAAHLVASLGLRDVESVDLIAVRVFAEPAAVTGERTPVRVEFVELSHVVTGDTPDGAGTRIEAPRQRFDDGADLAGLPLGRLADLPAVVVRGDLEQYAVAGHAVLLDTGENLTEAAARWLVGHGAPVVGFGGGAGPAAAVLLAAGIPVVTNLIGLADLPPTGARFTAVPPRIGGAGTSPVRAFAAVPWFEPHDHTRSAGWLPTGNEA